MVVIACIVAAILLYRYWYLRTPEGLASAAYDEARHELNMSSVKASIYGNREGLLDRCWACQKARAGTCRRHHAKVAQLAREKYLRSLRSSSQSKK